jgi:hypothetical protein
MTAGIESHPRLGNLEKFRNHEKINPKISKPQKRKRKKRAGTLPFSAAAIRAMPLNFSIEEI